MSIFLVLTNSVVYVLGEGNQYGSNVGLDKASKVFVGEATATVTEATTKTTEE